MRRAFQGARSRDLGTLHPRGRRGAPHRAIRNRESVMSSRAVLGARVGGALVTITLATSSIVAVWPSAPAQAAAAGPIWAWGWDAFGELGDGVTSDGAPPRSVRVVSGAAAVAAGSAHSLALLPDGRVLAWGLNDA